MPFEIAQKLIVVSGKVANCIVAFSRGVYDGLRVMSEAGKVGAVFLAQQRLDVFSLLGVVEL